MHISAFKQSKFLTRADVGPGMLVTIKSLSQEDIAKEGAPEELKWCMYFAETEKPLVVNATNAAIIASVTKSEETNDWSGHKIVLYDDPNVSFGGKLVGGIRVRAPRQPKPASAPAARPPAKPQPASDPYDAQPESPPEDDPSVPF